MALKDTWKDLEDAVAGVENSGSDLTVAPINAIAHAVIENEKGKVDKVKGKGLSTEDFTTEEKEKLAGLEKSIEDAVANLVNSAPDTLNTLDELAKALNNDENFASTVTNELATKADKSQLSNYATKDDLGDIETALDTIITIQNELIGGGNV